jgi:spore coat polysaccharide biosynthesis predicted glycosyltransferase SpsG
MTSATRSVSAGNRILRLVVRLDAGPVGLGHAVRVSGLLGLMSRPVDLLLVGQGDGLDAWFPGVRRVAPDDSAGLAAICAAERPDAVLLDIPRYPPGLFEELRAIGLPLICIDDMGGAVDADLIINGTILDDYHRYPNVRSNATLLLGCAYALIRPAFGHTPWRAPSTPGVAIVVGSGERAREWAYLLLSSGIDRSVWGNVTMVVGAAFPDRDAIAELAVAEHVALRQDLDSQALADLLSRTSVALITGGMIVYEAMAVGVPAVVFPQLENLIPEARFLAGQGCIADLGFGGGMIPAKVQASVGSLLADRARLEAMSHRQRKLIDGRGMERVGLAISQFLDRRCR